MYGTVMIGRLADGAGPVEQAMTAWAQERGPGVPGFVDAGMLVADDGETVVTFARFADKAAYLTLADDPQQDVWYREQLAPGLAGDPQWIDGEWADAPG